MLKELGEIITGNTPSKKNEEYWNSEDICFIKPDIIADSGISRINTSNEYISEEARKKARVVSEDAVFVTCIGSIGKIGIVSGGEYAFNQQINVIVPNEKINPQYLAYNLLFNKARLVDIANAPVVPLINKKQFGEFTINVEKNIKKQIKIVEVLDKIVYLIEKRTREITMLEKLVKARFVEMFGDPINNHKGWKVVTIGDVVTEVRYGTSKPAVEGGRYPYLRMNNLTADGHLDLNDLKFIDVSDDEIEKYVVRKGDVLFNRTNSIELVGKTAVFDLSEDMVIAGYIIRVRLNEKLLPEVLSQYMNLEALKDILRGMAKGAVNQANINAQELQSIKIYLPNMELQKQFVEIKAQIDKSKVAVQKALDETQTLFDSLMQKYFG
ncbi:Type I restriction enzyme EcoKI specificity protein [uncultured Clostridium sp.]|nr:Type I restriction enzyme EcoKI specificity protein [uncultured Clostridium sp.]